MFVYSTGKLVAEYSTQPPSQNPTTSYTATDHLGSPRVITDANGQVTSRRDFMPFGEELNPDSSYRKSADFKYGQTDSVRQRFTGYQKDSETNLDFAEARMYENRHGRFTAVDPLLASGKSANPQTFNRYVYVLNNPLAFTDPTGLCPVGGCLTYEGPVYLNKKENRFEEYKCKDCGDEEWRGDEITTENGIRYRVYNYGAGSIEGRGWYRIPIDVVQDTGNTAIRGLLGGFANGYNDSMTGARRGAANFGISLWNLLSHPLGPAAETAGVPNPFGATRYQFDNQRQASWGSRTEIGINIGLIFAGATVGGGSSSLSVVPRGSSTLEGTNAFRYMTEGEITAINETGLLRGGNPRRTYWTKDLYKSGTKASQRLSLETTPTHRVEFEFLNNPFLELNGTKVRPTLLQPGGGAEFMTIQPVRVRIINAQPIN